MRSTTDGRLGVVGASSGFVMIQALRFAAQVQGLGRTCRGWLATLPGRGAASEAPPARRGRRFAVVLAAHWRLKTIGMQLADSLNRVSRFRLGTAVLGVAGGLAIGAALFLPDHDVTAAAAPAAPETIASATLAELRPVALPARAVPTVPDLLPAKMEAGWQPVKRPFLVYNLEAPDVEAGDLIHRVAMRGRDARQDTLSWTVPAARRGAAARPAVHLVIERFEKAVPTFRPLFSDLATRAAEQGVSIDRMNAPGEFPTKFGGVEVADAVLQTEQGPLACLVFRRVDTIGFVVAGWYCGTVQRPADRVSLACFVDRLDLVGAGQDGVLKKHFANAERNRRSCAGARQSGRKLTWLDHEAPLPALKLSAKGPQAK